MLYGRWASKFKFAGTRVEQGKKVDKKFRKQIRQADKRKKAATEAERKKKGKKSETEIFESSVESYKESLIKKGYSPRGKDIQRQVNSYMGRHPLREAGKVNVNTGKPMSGLKITEKKRKDFLEFRQAKINKIKSEKKKRKRDIL